jgi:ADP-heptose:LPS heptosyltransferase
MRDPKLKNPKDYPYWLELVNLIKKDGWLITQIGTTGEGIISGVDSHITNLPLEQLKTLMEDHNTWISVDNFFQHFAWYYGKKGIVLFGQSDPLIFGHNTNINLLKDRKYLRQFQFDIWEKCEFREDVFVEPELVMKYLK